MTPTKREHDYDPEHPRRPVYFPEITLGNWIAIAAIAFGGVGLWINNEVRANELEVVNAVQDKKIDDNDARFKEAIVKLEAANLRLEEKVEKVDDKIDQIYLLLRQSSTRAGR